MKTFVGLLLIIASVLYIWYLGFSWDTLKQWGTDLFVVFIVLSGVWLIGNRGK